MVRRLIENFDLWGAKKSWLARVPLLFIFSYVCWQMFTNDGYNCWFSGLNLIVHEAGHLLTMWAGDLFCASAGSLFQCLVPILCLISLLRIPDYFGIPFCMFWLASNLFGVSHYVADARALALPLVSPGSGEAKHDWHFILGELDMLANDKLIAQCLAVPAYVLTVLSLITCTSMIYRMKQHSK